MLHAVNTQHGLQRIGPSAIARLGIKRLDDSGHILPWQNLLHAGEENLFSGLTALSAEFTIGEHVMMLISTVTEGSDKPYKYPLAFEKADIILLNKVDLIPYLDFDEEYYMKGVRALNKDVPVFKVSGKTGEGYEEVAKWLQNKAKKLNSGE